MGDYFSPGSLRVTGNEIRVAKRHEMSRKETCILIKRAFATWKSMGRDVRFTGNFREMLVLPRHSHACEV